MGRGAPACSGARPPPLPSQTQTPDLSVDPPQPCTSPPRPQARWVPRALWRPRWWPTACTPPPWTSSPSECCSSSCWCARLRAVGEGRTALGVVGCTATDGVSLRSAALYHAGEFLSVPVSYFLCLWVPFCACLERWAEGGELGHAPDAWPPLRIMRVRPGRSASLRLPASKLPGWTHLQRQTPLNQPILVATTQPRTSPTRTPQVGRKPFNIRESESLRYALLPLQSAPGLKDPRCAPASARPPAAWPPAGGSAEGLGRGAGLPAARLPAGGRAGGRACPPSRPWAPSDPRASASPPRHPSTPAAGWTCPPTPSTWSWACWPTTPPAASPCSRRAGPGPGDCWRCRALIAAAGGPRRRTGRPPAPASFGSPLPRPAPLTTPPRCCNTSGW